jgi:hypothetical protein
MDKETTKRDLELFQNGYNTGFNHAISLVLKFIGLAENDSEENPTSDSLKRNLKDYTNGTTINFPTDDEL